MAFKRVTYGDELIVVNGVQVHGAQSIALEQNFGLSSFKAIGAGYKTGIADAWSASITIDRILISGQTSDPLANSFYKSNSGFLLYGPTGTPRKAAAFYRAYPSSYRLSCAVGGLVEESTTFDIYGTISSGVSGAISNTFDFDNLQIPTYADVHLYVPHSGTNRIQSFDLSVACPTQPNYVIGGGLNPTGVFAFEPAEVSLGIEFEVDDLEMRSLFQNMCDHDIVPSIFITDRCGGERLRTINLPTGFWESESMNSAIGSNKTYSVSYKFYVNNTGELGGLVYG